MKKTATIAILAAAVAAGAVQAQTYRPGREPSVTLYERPNFQGRQTTIFGSEENLSRRGFNDLAQSARFQGRWRVCEHAGFGGRCEDVSGDIADLNQIAMSQRISSVEPYGYGGGGPGWGGGGPGWGGGPVRPGGRGVEGATGVFFPHPTLDGMDIAAGGMSANAFCRAQGLGSAAYYDSSQRAPRAIDGEGRPVSNTTILRDIFCRRR
ncbi:MAG: beta/gamma crystallin-related protein [Phenylobacterium sp.]|uniref:beta/gamma crystallin-related protein n=1 Tax=Phenylobacterium sp. TaxID=1871053 RepID=UPI003919563D